jgi:hypothetical protein
MKSENPSSHATFTQDSVSIWGVPLIIAGCSACEHAFLVPSLSTDMVCPNCAQASLNPQAAQLQSEPPELAVPFVIQTSQVSQKLIEFTQKPWLKPEDFKHENLIARLQKVFLPMWLVDCQISGQWQGEAGFNYQVKSSQEFFQGGSWQSRDITKTRVRWEPRLGLLTRMYNNVAVPAMNGYTQFADRIGKYRLDQAQTYQKDNLAEAVIRIPDLSPQNAWPIAQDNLKQIALKDCQQAVSADYLRNFSISAEFNNPHWTQLLLPLYFTWYRSDDGETIPIFIHGQSGNISGARLASRQKGLRSAAIAAGIAVLLFLLTLIFAAAAALFPFLSIPALLFGFTAFFTLAFALVPALYPWQWNRNQLSENMSLPSNQQKDAAMRE